MGENILIKFLIRDIPNNINSEEIKLNKQIDLKSADNMIQSILEKNRPFDKISISFRLIDSDSNKTIVSSSGFLAESHNNILDFLRSVDSVPTDLIDGVIDYFTYSDIERVNIDNSPAVKKKEKGFKESYDTNVLQKKIRKIKEENEKLNKNLKEKQKLHSKLKTKSENEISSLLKKQEQLKQELTRKIDDNKISEKKFKNEIDSINDIIEKTKKDISDLDRKHIEQKRLLNEKLLKIKEETKKLNNEKQNRENQEHPETENLKEINQEIEKNEKLKAENLIEDLAIETERKKSKNNLKIIAAKDLKLDLKRNSKITDNDCFELDKIKKEILQEISKEKSKEQKCFERKEQKYLRELKKRNRDRNISSNILKKFCFLIFAAYLAYLMVLSKNDIESYFSNLINGLKCI